MTNEKTKDITKELEELIQKHTDSDCNRRYEESHVRAIINRTEYALVARDMQKYFDFHNGGHWHYGEDIWIVYKPEKIVRFIDEEWFGDTIWREFRGRKRVFTPIKLIEKGEKVIAKYEVARHKVEEETKEQAFRWIKTIRQGKSKPKFTIEDYEEEENEDEEN